jgi:hypothetical protein
MKRQIILSLHEVFEILADYVVDNNLLDKSVNNVNFDLDIGTNPYNSYITIKES